MNVVIMVSCGYPKKFSANNSKGEYIAMGLKQAGCEVLMIDDILGSANEQKPQSGISQSGVPYTILPRWKIFNNFIYIYNTLKHRRQSNGNFILVGMGLSPIYLLTVWMSAILKYKRGTLFHELNSSFAYKKKIHKKIDAYLKDNLFGYCLNIIFPISHLLESKSKKFRKPSFIIPVLSAYVRKPVYGIPKYNFAFCGDALYVQRNTVILDAFKNFLTITKNNKYRLKLVLSGRQSNIDGVRILLERMDIARNVDIEQQLTRSELNHLYEDSLALLIPLDPDSLQDKARFSQKIAEYVASGRPIVTSSVGEIPFYFKNDVNAVIVPYSSSGYCDAMIKLSSDIKYGDEIGSAGYDVGFEFFNYQTMGLRLKERIEAL